MKPPLILAAIMLTVFATSIPAARADGLANAFRNPSEETKPWCYWYWLNGNVSKEGITKDIEAMAKVGIKLAMIGNISGQGGETGPVSMFSPEWYELTLHAFREANRLSVDLMMFNGPGWSQSGGPWIKPEQSMRRVAWSEYPAQGGAFSQKVRPDEILPGQDIAVLAVPRLQAVTIQGEPGSSSPDGGAVLRFAHTGPFTARSLVVHGKGSGKRRIHAEAFTSRLSFGHHPATIKARGEELFCEGVNHFVLHVYAHQPSDGAPGKNPWFGTAFHRNTPWFMESRDWVRYLQRCHFMLQQGEPVADVAVYIGDFAPQMTGPANPVPPGYDYDFMGSDAILRKLDVVNGEWVVYDEHDPKRISARWEVLAMPDAGYIRPHVSQRLAELRAKGGRIVDGVPVSETTLKQADIKPLVTDASCPLRWKARRLDDGMVLFLSNFEKTGAFEATLRVTGKVPELFDPVSGEMTRLARYRRVDGGTRVTLDIKDASDSCFLVFRNQATGPSVVESTAPPSELALFHDEHGQLTGEAAKAGTYQIGLSNGTTRRITIGRDASTHVIAGPWKTTAKEEGGFSVLHEAGFKLPAGFGAGQRVTLDLGAVSIMATVTLNDHVFDTLWRAPFALDVTDVLKPGANRLQVLVTSTTNAKPALGNEVILKTTTRQPVTP